MRTSLIVIILLACRCWSQVPAGSQSTGGNRGSKTAAAKAEYDRAQDALRKGDLDGAVAHMTKAATLAPKNPLMQYDLGVLLEKNGDHAEACKSMKSAVGLGLTGAQARLARDIANSCTEEAKSASERPSTSDIFDWMQRAAAAGALSHQVSCRPQSDFAWMKGWSSELTSLENCELHFKYTRETRSFATALNTSKTVAYAVKVPLANLSADVEMTFYNEGGDSCNQDVPAVVLVSANGASNIRFDEGCVASNPKDCEGQTGSGSSIVFRVETKDREQADKFRRAFSDAIQGCGGKKGKVEY